MEFKHRINLVSNSCYCFHVVIHLSKTCIGGCGGDEKTFGTIGARGITSKKNCFFIFLIKKFCLFVIRRWCDQTRRRSKSSMSIVSVFIRVKIKLIYTSYFDDKMMAGSIEADGQSAPVPNVNLTALFANVNATSSVVPNVVTAGAGAGGSIIVLIYRYIRMRKKFNTLFFSK